MRRWVTSAIIFSLLAVLLVAVPVFAYTYRGTYTVSENGTASHNMTGVIALYNNEWMIANGFITDSTALDTRIETLGGLQKPHMVTNNMTLTAVPIPASSQTNLYYSMGNSLLTEFDIILGAGGYITVADEDTYLELGDNFTIEQSGWVDTDYSANKTLVYKEYAFQTYVSADDEITSDFWASGDFPTVASVNGSAEGTNSVNHTVSLPSGIASDDLLLVFFASDELVTITFPGGWTQLFHQQNTAVTFGAWYRIADGAEGTTIIATTNTSQMTAHTSYRITDYSGVPEADNATAAASVNPDPPNLTPSWGTLNTLWFAACGYDGGVETVTVYPTNYTNGRNDRDATAGSCGVGSARRELNATSEDPGTFTISGAQWWVASTVAIAPAPLGVTATGVSSGERTVVTTMESPFFGIGIDAGTDILPVSDNMVLNVPLWQTESDNATFTTIDSYQHTCTVTGANWTSDGYCFDGADYIDLSDNTTASPMNFTSSNFTIEFIIYLNTLTANNAIINRCPVANDAGWHITVMANGRLRFTSRQAADGQNIISTAGDVTTGSWQWYSIIRSGTTVKMYRDATTELTLTSSPALIDPVSTAQPTKIGIWRDNVSEPIEDGFIGEVRIYNRALTTDEILQNYNATKSKYTSGDIYIYSTLSSVPDNSNDWLFLQNDVMPYSDNHTIWVGGTRQLWFRPNNIITGTTLPDRQGGDHNGAITWGANPAGVSVSLGGLVASAQPVPGAVDVTPTPDILPEVEVTDWFVEPDVSGTLLTNPLRPFVTMLSDNSTLTEIQSWRLYALAIILLVTVSTAGAVRGHHAITGFAAGASVMGAVVLTIFPMWALVFTGMCIFVGLISERSPVL